MAEKAKRVAQRSRWRAETWDIERDYFAAVALSCVGAHHSLRRYKADELKESAEAAYRIADAIMAAHSQPCRADGGARAADRPIAMRRRPRRSRRRPRRPQAPARLPRHAKRTNSRQPSTQLPAYRTVHLADCG